MRCFSRSSVLLPWTAFVFLWGSAFALACRFPAMMGELHGEDESVASRLFSSARVVLSENMYEMADVYFHRGAPHKRKKAFEDDFFQKVGSQISPTKHVHPRGRGVYEVMPWLRFATELDPHSVEPYLVAAFWLGDQGGRPDLAEEILNEAARNNPRDYRVYAEKARLYMRAQDAAKAARALDAGMVLWPGDQDPESEEPRLELAQMLSYRAFLYELESKPEKALEQFTRVLEIAPGDRAVRRRIAALQQGGYSTKWAEDVWASFFPRRQVCAREHEHEDNHDHDHESEHEQLLAPHVHGPACVHDHDASGNHDHANHD